VALLYGHRGAPGTGERENTLASFKRALDDGATALESDVHRTKDGHVVLSHDADLSRVFRKALLIRDSTLAELQLPTLRELLDFAPDVPINIDIKQPGIEREVIDAIGADRERVLLASFDVNVLRQVRALGYPLTGMAQDEVKRLLVLPRVFLRLSGKRVQVPLAHGRWRFDTKSFVNKCHAIGLKVDYWTINDVDTARRLLDLGADGIMSDDPGKIRPAFAM
jgi:glycerophosphoryl diester phosphodiesterase